MKKASDPEELSQLATQVIREVHGESRRLTGYQNPLSIQAYLDKCYGNETQTRK